MLLGHALIVLAFLGAGPRDVDSQTLDAMAGVDAENRAAFPYGAIHFRFSDGFAVTAEKARAGNLSDKMEGEGVYTFDEKQTRYDLIFPRDVIAKYTKKIDYSERSMRRFSFRLLSDGSYTLIDRIKPKGGSSIDSHSCTLEAGTDSIWSLANPPLVGSLPDRFRMNLATAVAATRPPGAELTIESVEDGIQYEGSDVVKVVFRNGDWRSVRLFDPARGSVILSIENSANGVPESTVLFDDVRFIADRGWLAHAQTTWLSNRRVSRYVITSADFRHPPGPDAFQLSFPTPVDVDDTVHSVSYRPRTEWSLASIPGHESSDAMKAVQPSFESPATPPAFPGERPARGWTFWALLGIGTLSLVLLLIVVCRRESRN